MIFQLRVPVAASCRLIADSGNAHLNLQSACLRDFAAVVRGQKIYASFGKHPPEDIAGRDCDDDISNGLEPDCQDFPGCAVRYPRRRGP